MADIMAPGAPRGQHERGMANSPIVIWYGEDRMQ
jgi:hypothetical protein